MSSPFSVLRYHFPRAVQDERLTVDLCVYGGTAGGVAAATLAARQGLRVVLLETSEHVGGLSASGLGLTDFGNKRTLGGMAAEFYRLVGRHYGKESEWKFEPHVAEAVFERWLKESGVIVRRREFLHDVRHNNHRIEMIRLESGLIVRAAYFIDATYEGDLLAAAGVAFTVGREDNQTYGETLNGMVIHSKHQFDFDVDPFRTEGAPGSGFLPGLEQPTDFMAGRGDHRIQAYNFRMCLTREPDNRISFVQPEMYDRSEYELLSRYFRVGWREVFAKFDAIEGKKTDTNNHGAVSTDFIGRNYRWPVGSFVEREALFQAHLNYQMGLQWFLTNDPSVPKDIRETYATWGLAKDEFVQTGGWPHALYVREGRRMISDYVITENDCRGRRSASDVIAFGSYGMDSHNCRRVYLEGRLRNEGDIQEAGFKPYPIPLRALLPKRQAGENLVVSGCISATHIAYGSVRMEPVFMMLGHAAAVIVRLATKEQCAVQDLPYAAVREALLQTGQAIDLKVPDAPPNQIV